MAKLPSIEVFFQISEFFCILASFISLFHLWPFLLGRAGRPSPRIDSIDWFAPLHLGYVCRCLQWLILCRGRRKWALVQLLPQDILGGLGRTDRSLIFSNHKNIAAVISHLVPSLLLEVRHLPTLYTNVHGDDD